MQSTEQMLSLFSLPSDDVTHQHRSNYQQNPSLELDGAPNGTTDERNLKRTSFGMRFLKSD